MLSKLEFFLPKLFKQLYSYSGRVIQLPFALLNRLLTRRLGLVLFSPSKAFRTACRMPANKVPITLKATNRELELASVKIHKNVICYPLTQTSGGNSLGDYFHGGLADCATQTLISDAIHYNGVAYSQSLPTTYIATYSYDHCLEIKQPVLFGGILFNHFGHFVSESLCRLYAYQMVRDINPYILFLAPWGLPNYLENKNFTNQILTGFGIPPDKLVIVNQSVKISEIFVPEQKYGFGFLHRPDEIFVKFVRSFRLIHEVPKGFENAEKIYVSRSGLQKRGAQIGEKSFEEYLLNEGYKIFYPEKYTIFEQLTVYARADKLLFSEGSAVLSCILLPDLQAEVAVVCRRRDPRRNIRVATDCLHGYGKRILWIDAVRKQYQFGLDTWDALAECDWYEVSKRLYAQGFVKKLFRMLTDQEHGILVKSELREYLLEISRDPKFIDYMMISGEAYPCWEGPSHIVDPRDGQPVMPVI